MVIGQPFSFARGGAHHTASVTKARRTKSGSPKAGPKGRQQDFCFYTFWGKKCFPHILKTFLWWFYGKKTHGWWQFVLGVTASVCLPHGVSNVRVRIVKIIWERTTKQVFLGLPTKKDLPSLDLHPFNTFGSAYMCSKYLVILGVSHVAVGAIRMTPPTKPGRADQGLRVMFTVYCNSSPPSHILVDTYQNIWTQHHIAAA